MRKTRMMVVLVLVGTTLGACGDADAKKATLKIGMINPQNGGLAGYGPAMENGARLAVSQINAAGGLLGKDVELVVRDSASDPTVSRAAATALVDEGVQVIIGAAGSGNTLAAAEVTVPAHVVQISGASTSPALTTVADDDFLFRTVVTDEPQALVLAQKIYDDGWRNLAILYIDNSYGVNLGTKLASSFEALGGTLTMSRSFAEGVDNTYNYQTDLAALYGSGPDAIALIAYETQGTSFLATWDAADYSGAWYLTDGMRSTNIAVNVGVSTVAGIVGTAAASTTGAAIDAFRADYQTKYGEAPGVYAENYYDAAMLVSLAIARAGAYDGTAIRDAMTPVATPPGTTYGYGDIAAALAAAKAGDDINYDGPSGLVDFDANGDVSGPIEIWRFAVDGTIESLEVVAP